MSNLFTLQIALGINLYDHEGHPENLPKLLLHLKARLDTNGHELCLLPSVPVLMDRVFCGGLQVLDDLDEHTWILEPEKASRSTTHRRVAVVPHCSVMLKMDPRAPGDVRAYAHNHASDTNSAQ